MTIRIANEEIPGTILVGRNEFPPAMISVRTRRFGLLGETEVRSRALGREIHVPLLLHNSFSSELALEEEKRRIDQLVSFHGLLELYGTNNKLFASYPFCTFVGFERRPGGEFGPLPDTTGLIDGGWWQEGACRFYQLALDDLPP